MKHCSLLIIAAPAVDRKHEWLRLVSETQNLWPPFDRCRKCGTDCCDCSRFSCPSCGAISTLDHRCCRRHGRGMASPLLLLPCHCPLGGWPYSWHSLRFLYSRRDRESRRLACWSPLVVRTSSFSWSADGEGLYAKGQPDCQSDYVVCRSDVPPLSRPWARSGHGSRVSRGASCFFWLHYSGRSERWQVTGLATLATIPKPDAPLEINE